MNNSLSDLVTAKTISLVLFLVFASQQVAAQAPIGTVEVSNGARGQSANSSLQQLQEMDAVRREMSELRDLIERQRYEFNQYKRKSDQEILALRQQLSVLQGGQNVGGIGQIDGDGSGFSLGGAEDSGNPDVQPLNVDVSNVEAAATTEVSPPIDEDPEAAMVGVSMGGYGQSASAPSSANAMPGNSTYPTSGPQLTPGSGFNSPNDGYPQNQNASIGGGNSNVVAPVATQPAVAPVTVEVVPAGGTLAVPEPAPVDQMAIGGENSSNSGTWETQSNQSGSTAIDNTGVNPTARQQSVQNNSSELQWQVIQSPGPSSAPLDDAVTGSQIDQSGGSVPAPAPQSQSSPDGVLGDL